MTISAKAHRYAAKWCCSETCHLRKVVMCPPLRFDPKYTNLDTVFGVLSRGHALLYEPAFEPSSVQRIQEAYPPLISLSDKEQKNTGANILCLSPDKVISIAENPSVSERLLQLGFEEVVTVPFSEVIKSGGSVRCDTLPVERTD